jgi:hypothetical protein
VGLFLDTFDGGDCIQLSQLQQLELWAFAMPLLRRTAHDLVRMHLQEREHSNARIECSKLLSEQGT